MTVKEVAAFLGVGARFVRLHYKELGGMRLGSRVYVFFEKEVINAVQRQNKSEKTMDRTNQDQWKESKTPMRHAEGGGRMGNQGKKATPGRGQSGSDPHGLLAGLGNSVP